MPRQTTRARQAAAHTHVAAHTKRAFASELLVELPACGGAPSVARFTHEREFMQGVVRRKALALQEHGAHCAAAMGTAWKIELAEALMPYDHPSMLAGVRAGIHNLFLARAGFLPQVVSRLNRLGISPQMLCPGDVGAAPCKGDDGRGPTAEVRAVVASNPRAVLERASPVLHVLRARTCCTTSRASCGGSSGTASSSPGPPWAWARSPST